MHYSENVNALCLALRNKNTLDEVPEEKIQIARIVFRHPELPTLVMKASDANRPDRLFVESIALARSEKDGRRFARISRMHFGLVLRLIAEAEFYVGFWKNLVRKPGRLPYYLTNYTDMEIVWKDVSRFD